MEYGDWDQSYNEVPKWLQAVQHTNLGTIFHFSVLQLMLMVRMEHLDTL